MKNLSASAPQRLKKYPAYKDSSVEWLGNIPADWKIKRLKYAASCNDEVLPESTDSDYMIQYVDISSVDITNGIANIEEMTFEKAPSRARRKVQDGDTIISTVRTYLKAIASITSPPPNLIVSTGFAVIRPKTEAYSQYLAYQLKSQEFVDAVVANSEGVSYPAINASRLIELTIVLPPGDKQQSIASFLDRKTTEIDALIGKKRRMIELLQEKRIAVISHAVTKGLDPNAPMKDSEVEWLGKVPRHWEVWKVTHGFFSIGSGTTPKSDSPEYYNGDIPWVTTTELRETEITDTNKKLTKEALLSYSALKIYPTESVLIAMYGATIGRLGILGIPATVNQACCVFSDPIKFNPKFIFYWLWMRRPIFLTLSSGGGQPNLSQDDLRQLRIPIPNIEEQRAIASFLDSKTVEIDSLITKIYNAIDKLLEYRTALISAAVTGKIDVRDEVGA